MGVFEIRLLNVYFNDKYKLASSNSNQSLFEKYFNMDFLKEVREEYSDIIDPVFLLLLRCQFLKYRDLQNNNLHKEPLSR